MRAIAPFVLMMGILGASEVRAEDPVSGFSTEGTGILAGEVTSEAGEPLSGVTVVATTPDGEVTTVTDAKGNYRMDLGPALGAKFVFVRRRARINGHTTRTATEDGEEFFDILEADKPKVMPRPQTGTNVVPEYSQAARDADVWARAWLILDVDDSGRVGKLKLVNRPGYGLDEIAVREAFKLRFAPAQNRAGKPMRALVLWTYEWPSYWWMIDNKFVPGFLPDKIADVPCKGTLSSQRRLRDCSQADVAKAHEVEWINAPSLPELSPRSVAAVTAPAPERWYHDHVGWVVSGTGAVLVGLGVYLVISGYQQEADADELVDNPVEAEIRRHSAAERKRDGWLVGGFGAAALGVGITRLVLHSDGATSSVAVAGRF